MRYKERIYLMVGKHVWPEDWSWPEDWRRRRQISTTIFIGEGRQENEKMDKVKTV